MWSTFTLSPDRTYVTRFPGVSIYTRADGALWRVATLYSKNSQRPTPGAPAKSAPKNLDWRYSALLGPAELTVKPSLPIRAYEVELTDPISVLPGVELDGYLFLPMMAELYVSNKFLLDRVPLIPPKTSWFGSTQEGILCDAVNSVFSTAVEVGKFLANPNPAIAVCPITIKNEMLESMVLARLCIPTDFLSIYSRGGIFATERVVCDFSLDGLRVNPRRGMDPILGKMNVEHPARKSPEARFFSKSADILRAIASS